MKTAASFLLPSSSKSGGNTGANNNRNNNNDNTNGLRERRDTEGTDLRLNTSGEQDDSYSVHPYSPTLDDVGTFGADQVSVMICIYRKIIAN